MNVSIIGAAGEVGRCIATQLLQSGLLSPSDRLQLIGHGVDGTERKVLAERCDLLDGFHERAPRIETAGTPDDVAGDVIVMTAGATVSHEIQSRRDLAAVNRPIFERFATALARQGTGREVVVVVTNPVELGVEIFSRHLDRRRVLGMGANQDSLRFARAVADDAGVRRGDVHAWVCGEHGEGQVPLWSSVQILGKTPAHAAALRGVDRKANFLDEITHHKQHMYALLSAERIRDAFDLVEGLPPDLRVVLEPFITAHCLHSTPNATANATCDVIRALSSGRESVIAAQVRLDGEFLGLQSVAGLPVLANAAGWSQVVCPPLSDTERAHLLDVAATIEANLAQWLA